MNVPLVSVILPCHNGMPFLEEALNSVLNQDYTNLEIICINDGSTDKTREYLDNEAIKDMRIKVIHNKENLKLIKTLNLGISLANGKYIARMDADDICYTNRITECVNYLESHPDTDILCPTTTLMNHAGKKMQNVVVRQHSAIGNLFASFFYVPIGHPEIIGKTEIFKENYYSLAPESLHTEDYELWCRLLSNNYKLVNIDTPLLYYRINNQSVSRKYTEAQDTNFIATLEKHLSLYFKLQIPTSIIQIIGNRFSENFKISDLKKAINYISLLRAKFIEMNQLSASNLHEIKIVTRTHQLDLLIQAFKKGSFSKKCFVFFMLIGKIRFIVNKTVRIYLIRKFQSRF